MFFAAAPNATPSTFETPLHNQTPHRATNTTTGTKGDQEGPTDTTSVKPEDHTLDKFLSKYQSEDDASFSEIMERTKAQNREKHAWLFEKEVEYSRSIEGPELRLAITDGSEGGSEKTTASKAVVRREEPERSGVESWTYTAKNSLMYIPEGLDQSVMEKVSDPARKREVVHSNTRLPGAFLRKLHGALRGGAAGEGEGEKKSKDKVGVDGKVLDPSASPQVNGYGFVATPQIQPGQNCDDVIMCQLLLMM